MPIFEVTVRRRQPLVAHVLIEADSKAEAMRHARALANHTNLEHLSDGWRFDPATRPTYAVNALTPLKKG